ncbi:hypothetical protein MTR_5g091290 [Medicago truncatula]|uniref:FAR1 domain-containing protein n=1 Tax=Medicago truncatula TaxID=3880 RepID=G7KD45_MEDTR|nr:hypothetical protein MTR_5g091290 [Medicago truncatula]
MNNNISNFDFNKCWVEDISPKNDYSDTTGEHFDRNMVSCDTFLSEWRVTKFVDEHNHGLLNPVKYAFYIDLLESPGR